jgi:proteic killer suppression protein
VIQSYRGKFSEPVSRGRCPKGFPADLVDAAMGKLRLIDAATDLNQLRIPPGNRLEKLKGSRYRQHSIRINDQWRVCFEWTGGGALGVEITDDH